MKKIRILETIRQGSFGGGETYLYNLVTRLNKDLFEPVVLSFTEGQMVDALRNDGIKTYVIHTEKPFDFKKYGQVKRILEKEKINLLHIHGTRAGTNTLIPALVQRIPAIYTVHGWSFHTGTHKMVNISRVISEKFLVSKSKLTICGSENDIRQGKEILKGGKYRLVRNSIDTEKFNPSLISRNLRKELGLKDNSIVAAFIARLTYQKNPETLVRAIPDVLKRCENVEFLFIGDGELKDKCITLSIKLKIQDKVTFHGFRTDIADVLNSIDIFILPSLWEVVPLGLLEAMAMQKACVATNIGGTDEALVNDVNGVMFRTGDSSKLAEVIISLAENKELRQKLGKKARETVQEKFDIKRLVAENEEIYSGLYKERLR